ncbi:anthranilate synthase component 1 [Corynebacterium glucuronolyticum]|uniref:anthranilate synthase n=2 Tax=Corynebacterium glucuronolyticum TaxID=39791 RepID=A0AAX1L945_9CORY|nr:anthranilate synthase component 1 [Corynebacterium glucuronolyticum]EEI63922.1 anthranilate synthase component I [Corynebacterium glucuronolyticum ATCC 51866]QRP70616.1 anthranilate synthase component 1 [Corynebacterium glucuronolyticum]
MQFTEISRLVRYHEDASALFHALGGASARSSVLLESADIQSKEGLQSIAVLKASARFTCSGFTVAAEALSPRGAAVISEMEQKGVSFSYSRATAAEEAERLKEPSTMDVLRAALGVGEGGARLPYLAGGIAFDYLETFEDLPEVSASANRYPDYQFLLAEVLLVVDHTSKTATLYGYDEDLIDRYAQQIAEDLPPHPIPAFASGPVVAIASPGDETFKQDVEKLKQNIYNGDIYQVVPARTFSMSCPDAFVAYRRLRKANPSPYMFYIRGVDVEGTPYELFGASPESNLKYDAATRFLQLCPIAGTRPRGATEELDIRAELELRTDAKELAEHTMLVDLARNDVARVAAPNTRRVEDLMRIDRYSRVMHLVSRVTATLAPDFDAFDAYRACMNMGTLTGAPKLRANELLRSVEGTRRGSYGGSVGYFDGVGNMDNCIVIRSAFVQHGIAHVQAGAGIVRDSDPQSEANETYHKSLATLSAIAEAQGAELTVER